MLIQHILNHTIYMRIKCEKQLKNWMNKWETERDRRRKKSCTKYLIIWTIEWITTDVGLVESYWRQRVYIHCSKGPIYSHLFCVNNRNESKLQKKRIEKKHTHITGLLCPLQSNRIQSNPFFTRIRNRENCFPLFFLLWFGCVFMRHFDLHFYP